MQLRNSPSSIICYGLSIGHGELPGEGIPAGACGGASPALFAQASWTLGANPQTRYFQKQFLAGMLFVVKPSSTC